MIVILLKHQHVLLLPLTINIIELFVYHHSIPQRVVVINEFPQSHHTILTSLYRLLGRFDLSQIRQVLGDSILCQNLASIGHVVHFVVIGQLYQWHELFFQCVKYALCLFNYLVCEVEIT